MYINNERDELTTKAEQGDVDAQYDLAMIWEKGDAVHLVNAYFWYSLAVQHGHTKAADGRDALGKRLSDMQKAEVEKWVARWKPPSLPTPPPRFYGDDKADILTWLQSWYAFHANDDWREEYGVAIETLDNPGWTVRIDLVETYLESKPFLEITEDHSDTDWMICQVKDGKFQSSGDPSKLNKILNVFRSWASRD